MEDSLYGFRFKSQTSLLVSDQHEIDDAEIEPMQWQKKCRQHEGYHLQPRHNYYDEATQTPNWEYRDQRVDAPFTLTPRRYEADGGQSKPTAWTGGGAVTVQIDGDSDRWKRQLLWHQTESPGHRPSCPTPQPIRMEKQVSDESMQMFAEAEPFETGDVSYDDIKNSIAHQHIKCEGGSDVSSVTMEDVCVDDQVAERRTAVHPDDRWLMDLFFIEDGSLSDESGGDVVDAGIRQQLHEANGETEDMWQ
ncbi:hypothetical protein CCMA1212_005453 [Trichoderma ghanense]|uniref:Uncharacterized protein n=1 Tax=Trichoderma ghanense TaxID=65468 RepID=A0ABY2H5H9_9HYPO